MIARKQEGIRQHRFGAGLSVMSFSRLHDLQAGIIQPQAMALNWPAPHPRHMRWRRLHLHTDEPYSGRHRRAKK